MGDNYRLFSNVHSLQNLKVLELIDTNIRTWKHEMFLNTLSLVDAKRILCIPLATKAYEDMLVWGGEASGEFSVRNAYKLL